MSVPRDVTLPCAAVCSVPSRFATSVATAYPVPLMFTVVSGSASLSLNNLNLPSFASLKRPANLSVPPVSYLPKKPMSTASDVPLF